MKLLKIMCWLFGHWPLLRKRNTPSAICRVCEVWLKMDQASGYYVEMSYAECWAEKDGEIHR